MQLKGKIYNRELKETFYQAQVEAMMKWFVRFAFLAIIFLLSGCVAGQSIKMAYEPASVAAVKHGIDVQVLSYDQREFVLSGDKQPNYIGHYRAGFGNTWGVTTQNKQPLADNLRRDVSSDLIALGFDVVDKDAGRILKIVIQDWNFDAYLNGKMWYQVLVSVKSANGEILAEADLEETIVIKGSFWVGAKYAFERELPNIYKSVVNGIVRDNQKILNALKSK